MDALGGRKQTTRGVWLAPAASSSGRGASTLSLSPPPALPLLVLDLEGSDGRERGEDDAAFERRAALFALAVADAVVVNMWAKDVGREAGAGKPLLKTILHVNLKLFANGIEGNNSFSSSSSAPKLSSRNRRKTTLLFVFRDRTRTPLSLLSATWQADLEALWASLTKPPALRDSALSDFFDVRYAALSNFEEREAEFCAEAGALASLFGVAAAAAAASTKGSLPASLSEFVDSERPMLGNIEANGNSGSSGNNDSSRLPGEAWVLSANKAWETICSAKDLDLPAHRVMVASIRCGELAAESLESLRASEAFGELMRDAAKAAAPPKKEDDGEDESESASKKKTTFSSPPPQIPIPNFAPCAASLLETCLRSYDAEAAYYEEGTRAAKREELVTEAAALLSEAHAAQVSALAAEALARYRAQLLSSAASSPEFTFVERAAAAKAQAVEEFTQKAKEADSVPGTGWNSSKSAVSLSAACDAHARRERAAAVAEAEAVACASLRDALAKPAAALFDAAPPPASSLWRRARSLLFRSASAAADRAEAAVVASYGLSEDDAAALRSRIGAFGSRVVASKAREAAASALPRAKQRFSEVFSRDENGLPRHWASVGSGTGDGASSSSSSSPASVAEDIRHAAVGARRAAASLLASLAVLRLDEDDWGSSGEGGSGEGGGAGEGQGEDEIESAVLLYAAGDDGAALAAAASKQAAAAAPATSPSQPPFDLDAASAWPFPATEEGTLLTPAELRSHWRAVVADSAVAVAGALAAADAAAQAGAARRAGGAPLWSLVAMAILGANEAAGLLRSPLRLIIVLSLLLFVRTVYNELDVDGELAARGLLPAAIAIAAKLWPTTVRVATRTLDAVLGALAGAAAGGGGEVVERQRRRGDYGDDGGEGEDERAPAPSFARNSSNSFSEGQGSGSMRQRRPVGSVEMTTTSAVNGQ